MATRRSHHTRRGTYVTPRPYRANHLQRYGRDTTTSARPIQLPDREPRPASHWPNEPSCARPAVSSRAGTRTLPGRSSPRQNGAVQVLTTSAIRFPPLGRVDQCSPSLKSPASRGRCTNRFWVCGRVSRPVRALPVSAGRLLSQVGGVCPVSYTHLRAHETVLDLVCRLLLE